MPKKTINFSQRGGSAMNRSPSGLGPGVLRMSATEGEDEAEVFIYGDIGGWWGGVSAEQFAKDLATLDVGTLNVRLNSPGGMVFEGVAIYNALARHKANVIVHIEGIAASIASVIAMAGDEIRIAEGSRLMIHDPWSIVAGTAVDLRAEADVLDGLKSDLIDIYAARTEQKRDDLASWMTDETWLSARDAVDKGFADEMTPAKKKRKESAHAQSTMFAYFRNAPRDLSAGEDQAPIARDFESFLREGEGISQAQAKRIVAAARAITAQRDPAPRSHRDDGEVDRDRVPQPQRDDGAATADRLAGFLIGLRS